jgi:hypothetical protein
LSLQLYGPFDDDQRLSSRYDFVDESLLVWRYVLEVSFWTLRREVLRTRMVDGDETLGRI